LLNIYHFISGLAFKNKNYYINLQNFTYFKRENFRSTSKTQVSLMNEAPGLWEATTGTKLQKTEGVFQTLLKLKIYWAIY
jgi:hypothetical protein